MTTICASRQHGQMAGDTRLNIGAVYAPTKKVFEVNGRLVGAAGLSIHCNAFIDWLNGGDKPDFEDESFEALVLDHEGLWYYEADCHPMKIERDFHAIGSGSQAAIAALMCGKPPKRAVEIACQIDNHSGKPIDVLSL